MAASWMKAALASSSVLLRASRPERVLSRRAPLASWRCASTAANPLPEGVGAAQGKAKETTTLGEDQPTFASLEGKVSRATLSTLSSVFKITNMSPVQAAVLPLLPELAEPYLPDNKSPRDLLVKARTGTGKTLGFLIPAVEARLKALRATAQKALEDAGLVSDHNLEARAKRSHAHNHAGALIISPTRELATQIANEALRLTSRHEGFEVRLFVGGASKRLQMRDWMRGRRDIVVATPGRMRDLLENEPEIAKGLQNCPFLILDEADTLLEMGFREDIDAIASFLPKTPQRQTFLFSATVSREIRQVARSTLDQNHLFIDCVPADSSPVHAHVPQYHTVLPSAAHQLPHILRLIAHDQLSNPGHSKTIVFLPTTKTTQLFSTFIRELSDSCLPAGRRTGIYEIHSKRTMESRSATSNRFRAEKSDCVLISSDVSARGIDYPGVTRIIQVGIPSTADQYVHRVGRTGRGHDKIGRADMVLLPWELGFVTWQLTDIPLRPLTVTELTSQVKDLAEKSTPGYIERMEAIPKEVTALAEKLDPDAIKETLAAQLGFYIGKSAELRVQKSIIVEGLKDWTVEACGLPQPPYISPSFLEKLGINDGRTKSFGRPRANASHSRDPSRPVWAQRGNVKKSREIEDAQRWDERSYGRRDDSSYGRERSFGREESGREQSSYGRQNSYGRQEQSSYGRREQSYGNREQSSYGRREPSSSRGGYGNDGGY